VVSNIFRTFISSRWLIDLNAQAASQAGRKSPARRARGFRLLLCRLEQRIHYQVTPPPQKFRVAHGTSCRKRESLDIHSDACDAPFYIRVDTRAIAIVAARLLQLYHAARRFRALGFGVPSSELPCHFRPIGRRLHCPLSRRTFQRAQRSIPGYRRIRSPPILILTSQLVHIVVTKGM
jgi:hypothetical protein